MPDMTLQEALQTPEVKGYLGGLIQEAVEEALPAAVEAEIETRMPAIRESVREEIRKDGELGDLHVEATRLIEAARLPEDAKALLRADYALGDDAKPGRALALVEAVVDGDGKVTKSAREVLRESVEEDVKRVRKIAGAARPSVPVAPGGGSDGGQILEAAIDPEADPQVAHLRAKGLMPTSPTPTT